MPVIRTTHLARPAVHMRVNMREAVQIFSLKGKQN
jgi:hypothetical protein